MPAESKYKKKYAKELINGLRKDGLIIEEICQKWGITAPTYRNWKKEYPEFAEATEIGERDYRCWWAARYRNTAIGVEHGNAVMLNLAAKNYLGMVDKQEIHNTHEEQITTIKIEYYKPAETHRIIEHERTENLLDEKPS